MQRQRAEKKILVDRVCQHPVTFEPSAKIRRSVLLLRLIYGCMLISCNTCGRAWPLCKHATAVKDLNVTRCDPLSYASMLIPDPCG